MGAKALGMGAKALEGAVIFVSDDLGCRGSSRHWHFFVLPTAYGPATGLCGEILP